MAQSNILKLTGFTANVEVLGKVRKVRFEDSALEIEGLTLASAHKVLGALGTGKLDLADEQTSINIEGNEAKPNGATTAPPDPPQASTGDPPKKVRRRKKKDADPPSVSGGQPAEDSPPKAAASEKSSATSESKSHPETESSPPVEGKKNNGKLAELPQGIAADDFLAGPEGVHEDLFVMSKLRDILGYIINQGIEEDAEILAVCEQIRDKVPYLSRMKNIEERVSRTLGVMDRA